MKPYIKNYANWCYTAPADDASSVRNMNAFMIPSLKEELESLLYLGADAFGEYSYIYTEAVELLTEALDVWEERLNHE